MASCPEKCFRDSIALTDLVQNANFENHDKICTGTTSTEKCKKKSIEIITSTKSDKSGELTMILTTSAASVAGVMLFCVMVICICRCINEIVVLFNKSRCNEMTSISGAL